MAETIRTILAQRGVLSAVALPLPIDTLLSLLETVPSSVAESTPGTLTGEVALTDDLSDSPLPGLDLALTAPTDLIESAPFRLVIEPDGFKFWLVLVDQGQIKVAFRVIDKLPSLAFTGAIVRADAEGRIGLDPRPAGDPLQRPLIVSRAAPGVTLGPALLVAGSAGEAAHIRFTPDTSGVEGVVAFGFEPPAVVFGGSGIGFECPAFVIDDSGTAAPDSLAGVPALVPPLASIRADAPAWRGLLARRIEFHLPRALPVFGGRPIAGYFALPFGAGGANLVVATEQPAVPAAGGQPGKLGFALRIECIDPTAQGLAGLLPTLISASVELPLDGATQSFSDKDGTPRTLAFVAGKPVRLTTTLARDALDGPSAFRVVLAVAAQGPEGILSLTSSTMGGAKIFNTAAALATALIADEKVADDAQVGDTTGVVLAALASAGAALSSLLEDESRFVLHGAEIESTGHGAPLGETMALTIDYSVAARVTGLDLGAFSVEMHPDQPMRVRVRGARMSVDARKRGLEMIGLDFDRAQMEIENPGAWNLTGLDQLFDVLGSRSGRGSSWVEVDLRFKLNLGPVRVSSATIRGTLGRDGTISATISGLEATLDVPGAIRGKGALTLRDGGFEASLAANVIPLNLAADAGVVYLPPAGPRTKPMVLLRLDVDLPAPIPLANSGFGLFGIGGLLGFHAVPDYGSVTQTDPILRQLAWQPKSQGSFRPDDEKSTFGLGAVVGTLPDLGLSFSAKARLLVSVPEVAVRGALDGRVLQPPVRMSDADGAGLGVSFLGLIAIDANALQFAVLGRVDLGALLRIRIPIAGHFPFANAAHDWWLSLGDDGRRLGPIAAQVLPTTLDVGADAYLMFCGRIDGWPKHSGGTLDAGGFVGAFGFGVHTKFGVYPIAWAELAMRLDLLLGTRPPTLAGFGRASGGLHLGPFSLGVQAEINFLSQHGETHFWARVTGRIELLFFDVEGTVTIAFGDKPALILAPPEHHPLDRLDPGGVRVGTFGTMTDDTYRVLAPLVEDPRQIPDAPSPVGDDPASEVGPKTVWPDALISLPFAAPPDVSQCNAPQFAAIKGPGAPRPEAWLGTEMLRYRWSLDRLVLLDVTDEADPLTGAGVAVAGGLACCWQAPRSSQGAGDISELVLFETKATLWVDRLGDAGASLPHHPIAAEAEICRREAQARPGWAIGWLTEFAGAGLRLPPETISLDPFCSRVEARLHHFALSPRGAVTPLDGARVLPPPYSLRAPALRMWAATADVEHPFTGELVAPSLRWLDGRPQQELLDDPWPFVWQRIDLVLTEAVLAPVLVLSGEETLFADGEAPFRLSVRDDRDPDRGWEAPALRDLPGGAKAAVYRAPAGSDAVAVVSVFFPLGAVLGVAGIGGITVSAGAARDAEQAAIAAQAALHKDAADAGPPAAGAANVAHQRTILTPGRTYRIDIDMTWLGQLFEQDKFGQPKLVPPAAAGVPAGYTATGSERRQLFFRTTPKPVAEPLPYGPGYVYWLRRKQDVFHPEMIERYLGGYEPGQSEQFRFCDDPIKVQFVQGHVAALAGAYGFAIEVAVRRVDRPGAQYDHPEYLTPAWWYADSTDYLSSADQLRFTHALASPCEVPGPGATARVEPALEPDACYEVYTHAKCVDGSFANSRLRGVTFRTSRWRDPTEMIGALGFALPDRDGDAVLSGDLEVTVPPGPVAGASTDRGFEDALAELGLARWPPCTGPRLSRLWRVDASGAWEFAGLMIESPEPIVRPGRLAIDEFAIEMGRAGLRESFGTVHQDRIGARLIVLADEPFPIVTRETVAVGGARVLRVIEPKLVLRATARLDGTTTALAGRLVIPAQPGFAEEP